MNPPSRLFSPTKHAFAWHSACLALVFATLTFGCQSTPPFGSPATLRFLLEGDDHWYGRNYVAVPYRLSNVSGKPIRISQWPGPQVRVSSCRTRTGYSASLIGGLLLERKSPSEIPSFYVDIPAGGALRGRVVVHVPTDCTVDIILDGDFSSFGPERPLQLPPSPFFPDSTEIPAAAPLTLQRPVWAAAAP